MQPSSVPVLLFDPLASHCWFQVSQDPWPYFNNPGSHAALFCVLFVVRVNCCWSYQHSHCWFWVLQDILHVHDFGRCTPPVSLVNFVWTSTAQLILISSTKGLITIFYSLRTGSCAAAPCNLWLNRPPACLLAKLLQILPITLILDSELCKTNDHNLLADSYGNPQPINFNFWAFWSWLYSLSMGTKENTICSSFSVISYVSITLPLPNNGYPFWFPGVMSHCSFPKLLLFSFAYRWTTISSFTMGCVCDMSDHPCDWSCCLILALKPLCFMLSSIPSS